MPAIIRSTCSTTGRPGPPTPRPIRDRCPASTSSIRRCGNSATSPGSWSTGVGAIAAKPCCRSPRACRMPTAGTTRAMCRTTAAGSSTCPTGMPRGAICRTRWPRRWRPCSGCPTPMPRSTSTASRCSTKTCTTKPSATRGRPWPGRGATGWPTCLRTPTSRSTVANSSWAVPPRPGASSSTTRSGHIPSAPQVLRFHRRRHATRTSSPSSPRTDTASRSGGPRQARPGSPPADKPCRATGARPAVAGSSGATRSGSTWRRSSRRSTSRRTKGRPPPADRGGMGIRGPPRRRFRLGHTGLGMDRQPLPALPRLQPRSLCRICRAVFPYPSQRARRLLRHPSAHAQRVLPQLLRAAARRHFHRLPQLSAAVRLKGAAAGKRPGNRNRWSAGYCATRRQR